ncbi:MAG: ParB/RepB/Spo0J family partition protein [Actinomycetota bacterium]|jgi:ParB family chromosome partitioning protein
MARKTGLGKGLSALIPEGEETTPVTSDSSGPLREIEITSITPNRFQPRAVFDAVSLSSLAESIKEMGVLMPLIVRPSDSEDFDYELIAGERRLRAAALAGLTTIPVLVQESTDDRLSLEQAIVENLHRVDLHALEEASAYQQLIDDFDLTHDQVALRVGKSRATVTNTLRLLQLGDPAQAALAKGTISAGHARALLGLVQPAAQDELLAKLISGDLSVRATEELVRQSLVPKVTDNGGVEGKKPSTTSPTLRPVPDASVTELESLLEDYLDTRVHVEIKGRTGKIVIDFADLDDLERIYTSISTNR